MSIECSKRPRAVANAADECAGVMIAFNYWLICVMKKTLRPAAIGKSLEALGSLMTENYYSIKNAKCDLSSLPEV